DRGIRSVAGRPGATGDGGPVVHLLRRSLALPASQLDGLLHLPRTVRALRTRARVAEVIVNRRQDQHRGAEGSESLGIVLDAQAGRDTREALLSWVRKQRLRPRE